MKYLVFLKIIVTFENGHLQTVKPAMSGPSDQRTTSDHRAVTMSGPSDQRTTSDHRAVTINNLNANM